MRLSLPRLRMPRVPGFGLLAWLFAALKGWVMASRDKDADSLIMYDRTLLWLTFGSAAMVLFMVTSASHASRAAPGERSVFVCQT